MRKLHQIEMLMPLNMFRPPVQNCSKGCSEGGLNTPPPP